MIKMLYIVLCIVFCGVVYGKPVVKPDELPINIKQHIDAIHAYASNNDWVSVRKEYDKINWRLVPQPTKILRDISKDLKGHRDTKELRKEIKTKYQLLREPGDSDLVDNIEPHVIPVVAFKVTKFPAVQIDQVELITLDIPSLFINSMHFVPGIINYVDAQGIKCNYTDVKYLDVRFIDITGIAVSGLKYTYLDILKLDIDALIAMGINIPTVDTDGVSVVVIRTKDKQFLSLMDLWEKRYDRVIDFWDEDGNKVIPTVGSKLWKMRKELMTAIERGLPHDQLWNEYNKQFSKMARRRIILHQYKDNIDITTMNYDDVDIDIDERGDIFAWWNTQLASTNELTGSPALSVNNLRMVGQVVTPENSSMAQNQLDELAWFKSQGFNGALLVWKGEKPDELVKLAKSLKKNGWILAFTYGPEEGVANPDIYIDPAVFKNACSKLLPYCTFAIPTWRRTQGAHITVKRERYHAVLAGLIREVSPTMPILGDAFLYQGDNYKLSISSTAGISGSIIFNAHSTILSKMIKYLNERNIKAPYVFCVVGPVPYWDWSKDKNITPNAAMSYNLKTSKELNILGQGVIVLCGGGGGTRKLNGIDVTDDLTRTSWRKLFK